MDDTSCGENCAFVRNGMCKNCKDCPNYIESWWTTQGAAQPKLVQDCAPRRMLIQQQHMQLRLEQLTADLCEARVQYVQVANHLQNIIELSKIDQCKADLQPKKIENHNENVPILNLPHDDRLHAN